MTMLDKRSMSWWGPTPTYESYWSKGNSVPPCSTQEKTVKSMKPTSQLMTSRTSQSWSW